MTVAKDKRLVVVDPLSVQEAKRIMNEMQYFHAVGLVKRLVDFDDKPEMVDMPITPSGDFHRLELSGGIFGSLSFRVIFKDHFIKNEIVVLKTVGVEDTQDEDNELWMQNAEIRLDYYLESGITSSTIVYHG